MAVVHLVMLYGSETWVMTPHIGRVLGVFHHSVAHSLTGREPWQGRDSVWTYPPLEFSMPETVMQEVETYVSCLHNTVAKFIKTRPIV